MVICEAVWILNESSRQFFLQIYAIGSCAWVLYASLFIAERTVIFSRCRLTIPGHIYLRQCKACYCIEVMGGVDDL